ncbi:hypothetical protein STIAU_8838 [Stigmatella aurantiaca DW4/3-1]|uniref:Uncharacterized protein n=1 Tax=Stigmatella aurantiaca (strain DW4/3-1) TaxID=378806 RepID=Q091K5_STIAD|nr:hypothetical protein STIAU_8838 [Stigmatella aurantiaca DW4/3-1]
MPFKVRTPSSISWAPDMPAESMEERVEPEQGDAMMRPEFGLVPWDLIHEGFHDLAQP